MNDNLKEAFKELENLDVCAEGKETIKKILCKVVGEKYEPDCIDSLESLMLYKIKYQGREKIMVKIPNETSQVFIHTDGSITRNCNITDKATIEGYESVKKFTGEFKINDGGVE